MRLSKLNEAEPRIIPRNELDLNMLTTESAWGKSDVSKTLRERLTQVVKDTSGNIGQRELWGILSFFTRDMRLANLSAQEMVYCQYYLDLAGDLLNEDSVEPFIICLSRAAAVLELSQSKKGFLRKLFGTFTHVQVKRSDEPAKMSLMGKKKGDQ